MALNQIISYPLQAIQDILELSRVLPGTIKFVHSPRKGSGAEEKEKMGQWNDGMCTGGMKRNTAKRTSGRFRLNSLALIPSLPLLLSDSPPGHGKVELDVVSRIIPTSRQIHPDVFPVLQG